MQALLHSAVDATVGDALKIHVDIYEMRPFMMRLRIENKTDAPRVP